MFAGKIAKPNFSSLRLDLKGIYYMPSVIKASKIGDAAIIKSIIKILANEDIKVISSIYFNQELSLKKGNYTKTKPNKYDNNSIKKAKNYFNKINSLDHIQALVVKDEKIIAKEGRQGTKKMLSKVKSGLSTLSNISGLNFTISSTVLFIFDLILKILSNTLVNPKYVISFKS